MGTSTSYRSPPTPRYAAFGAALGAENGAPRAVAELYRATEATWGNELAGAALVPFATAAIDAHASLGRLLGAARSPGDAIAEAVRAARNDAVHSSGGSLAVALGERALARLLLGTLAQAPSARSADAADAWQTARGPSGEALGRSLVAEVLRQLALHVSSRDVAQLVGREGRNVHSARELVREVADRAATVAATATRDAPLRRETLTADWSRAVAVAFEAGKQLPGAPGA